MRDDIAAAIAANGGAKVAPDLKQRLRHAKAPARCRAGHARGLRVEKPTRCDQPGGKQNNGVAGA